MYIHAYVAIHVVTNSCNSRNASSLATYVSNTIVMAEIAHWMHFHSTQCAYSVKYIPI